jgi:ABC-2 type transport system ATP-binding protein
VSEPIIEVLGLCKRYRDIEALKGIDLTVNRSEVFALLGPNGAGKTTAVEILEGHRSRDSGEVRVLGVDPARAGAKFRARIGIVLQQAGVERFLTVEEVIELFRGYYPSPRSTEELLSSVGLEDKRKSLVRRLSGGQVRRLDTALALAGDPDLLFLDEPTSGLDPAARRDVWRAIEGLRDLGKTIMLTTHNMEEAERLSDRLAIIAAGRIVADGTAQSLRQQMPGTIISFRRPDRDLPEGIRQSTPVHDGLVTIETDEPTTTLHHLTAWAYDLGIDLHDLKVMPTSLEDVYLRLVSSTTHPAPQAVPPPKES